MKLKVIVLLIVLGLNISCGTKNSKKNKELTNTDKQSSFVNVEVSYKIESDKCYDKLIATVNGKEKVLVDFSEKRKLNIQLIDDFNNDGNLDILIENINGCNNLEDGYSISWEASSYFLFSTDGYEFFRTKEVGNDWGGIKIEVVADLIHFTIDTAEKRDSKEGYVIPATDVQEVYILDKYALKLVTKEEIRNLQKQEIEKENTIYRVFAKNGLLVRDAPNGDPIGKVNFNEEVTVVEKTDIEFEFKEDEYTSIHGYWYQI